MYVERNLHNNSAWWRSLPPFVLQMKKHLEGIVCLITVSVRASLYPKSFWNQKQDASLSMCE